ncbi:MAG: hypothetical protein CES88_03380 [Halobacteriovorax sp. JY17]|nr:MAG: hypothetical protein CES88_03380 [Halobacteriovorax sp. JY17]
MALESGAQFLASPKMADLTVPRTEPIIVTMTAISMMYSTEVCPLFDFKEIILSLYSNCERSHRVNLT